MKKERKLEICRIKLPKNIEVESDLIDGKVLIPINDFQIDSADIIVVWNNIESALRSGLFDELKYTDVKRIVNAERAKAEFVLKKNSQLKIITLNNLDQLANQIADCFKEEAA